MPQTIKQLSIKNKELLSHLAEIEETLNAIRNGDMDAIVVSGTNGDQVYTLNSAETPYRTFIEEMMEGAVTLSKEGIILFCNKRFTEFVHQPIEHVVGSNLTDFICPDDKPKLDYLLSHKSNYKYDTLIVSLVDATYLKLTFHLLPPYLQGENWIIIATDITGMKQNENKLLELQLLLEQKLNVIEYLRMRLIDEKIDDQEEIKKLKISNKKMFKVTTKQKLLESKLKQQTGEKNRI